MWIEQLWSGRKTMSQFENKLQSFLDATSLLFFYEVNRIQTAILF